MVENTKDSTIMIKNMYLILNYFRVSVYMFGPMVGSMKGSGKAVNSMAKGNISWLMAL
jgi:hypothetical protein